jgi:LytS/YehU family sensor histidine kinase
MLTESFFTSNGYGLFLLFVCFVLLSFGDYFLKLKYFIDGRFLSQHTLNNLLQNILYQTRQKDTQLVIDQIGKVVNYGFQHQQKIAISIADELACCKELLDAHNEIYQSKIEIQLEVIKTDLQNKIAPFSLAVVLENALKYGFVKSKSECIKIRITSNYFSVKVYLSGYDLPEQEVVRFPKIGHGLYSLKNRLNYFNYYFGCDYLKAIQLHGNELVLSIAKTNA